MAPTENKKAQPTRAQQVFGKDYGNRQIITKRPKSMSPEKYRSILKEQNELIRNVLR